ncbi:hypothetical protein GCM10015535_09270 [Streptomyces gelaticus]|uniref:Nucleopolyhedrovirus P10 family protein n=1 Tax=Streptomyces gelaticus TaxID=285446 RepID=A0ABQ2VS96_9ACTN|nr:hypothetical protein [Streptomyces gelaticus]GGV76801.1 hypothetical protein GCM10015535_09270 [Streptomyces gelaticus]
MTTADGPRGADGWAAAVRLRLGLGRLLPLGGPADGAWISERAAVAVLRGAVTSPGAALGKLRISVADPDGAPGPEVEPPPSALPPGPLRIEVTMSAVSGRPLPVAADALRSALLTAAGERLGLVVDTVDVRVTALLDAPPERPAPAPMEVHEAAAEGVAGTAAAGVPGVVTLTGVLGRAVHADPDHVRIELATDPGHRALDVARAVRSAVAAAVEGHPSVAVLVTAVVERD